MLLNSSCLKPRALRRARFRFTNLQCVEICIMRHYLCLNKSSAIYCLIVLFYLFSSGPGLSAEAFQIIDRYYPTGSNADQIKNSIDQAMNDLENQVNNSIPDEIQQQNKYLEGSAKATALGMKGLGVDYVSNPEVFVMSAGVSAGANFGDASNKAILDGRIDENDASGAGLQVMMTMGVNLNIFKKLPAFGWFDLRRLNAYVSFYHLASDAIADEPLETDIYSFAANLQYRLIENHDVWGGMFGWGGVSLVSGMQYTSMNIVRRQNFTQSQSFTVDPGTGSVNAEVDINALGRVGADVDMFSIPLEAATSVRFFWLFSLYGGVGADLNVGSAASIASVDGPITGDIDDAILESNTPGTGITSDKFGGTARLDLGESQGPSLGNIRYFAGLQMNIYLFRVFAGVQHSVTNSTVAAHFGARLVY